MSSSTPDVPAPPDYAKTYQEGIDVFLKNYQNLLEKEREAREQYDPERIAQQQRLQEEFGPIQVQQQLDALRQFDPESFAVREALAGRIQSDLESGYDLGDDYSREIEQSVRGAQTARGNIYGQGPASAEASVKGRAALELYQQRLNNAGNFLSGPTPTQQSLALSGVQPDRGMSYVTPNAGTQGVNFGLSNYQNLLAQQQLVGSQRNPWSGAASGAATGAAAGSAAGPWGALIGAAVGGVGGYYSDYVLKADVRDTGKTHRGIRLVEFNYKGHPQRFRGVIAQDVEKIFPSLVSMIDGLRVVDYASLGLEMEVI